MFSLAERMNCNRVVVALMAIALAAAAGCDDRPFRVPVSGTVMIDGQPLTHGYVMIVPEDARPAGGKIGPDGRFTLTCYDGNDGCVPGKHKVAVIAHEALDGSKQRWHAPKKYLDPETSGLSAEITEPTDSLVIELTWAGGKPFIEYASGGTDEGFNR